MQKYELAISDFEWVVSVDPYKPSIFCNLATSYFAVGRYQDALDSAWRSHQVDPTCSAEYLLEVQARSSYTLGDYDQALIYINKAMEMEPYTLGYYYRGTIYQALGDTKSAIEEYEVFLSDAVRLNYQGPEIADAKARLKILKP
jgi:tetratricopeptide (TPR) repeat protein